MLKKHDTTSCGHDDDAQLKIDIFTTYHRKKTFHIHGPNKEEPRSPERISLKCLLHFWSMFPIFRCFLEESWTYNW